VVANNYPISSATTVNYYSVEESDGSLGQVPVSNSDTYSHLYYDAAVGCEVYLNP